MNLSDATERAAVDLFLRNLYFTFPARDVVGIPGNIIGFPEPHQKEEDSALLVHELEHINSLMFPIGPFFTALAFRAHELRNNMTTQFIELQDEHLAIIEKGGDFDSKILSDALKVVLDSSQMAEFARLELTTAELMAPLLEGLAMLSEMELEERDSTWSWMLAVGLEYNYHEHRLALNDSKQHKLLEQDDDVRDEFVERLFKALEAQLKLGRERRLQGELIDRIFFPATNDDRALTGAPYFYGYLYLNRLYQEWKGRRPDLEFERFASLASKLLCSVIPLTISPIYSIQDHGGDVMSNQLPTILKELLKDFLSLSAGQIRHLEDRGGLHIWSLVDSEFKPWGADETPNKEAQRTENKVIADLIVSIFDLRDTNDPKVGETIEFIKVLERSKFLVRTGAREVFVIGIDEEAGAAILADPKRLTKEENQNQALLKGDGATFFKFQDGAVLKKFISVAEGASPGLARVKLGEAPYKVKSNQRVFPAHLQTFCYFWPFGVPQDDPAGTFLTSPPVRIVRVLFCRAESEPESNSVAFLDGPEIGDLAALVSTRDLMNRDMHSHIARALNPEFADSRFILGEIESLFFDPLTKDVAAQMLSRYPEGQLPAIQARCRGVYTSLLFPAMDKDPEQVVSLQRLNALARELGRADMTTLRRWLKKGITLQPGKAYELGIDGRTREDEQLSLGRIRAAALATLGVPLVNYSDDPPRIILDLVPPSAGSVESHTS